MRLFLPVSLYVVYYDRGLALMTSTDPKGHEDCAIQQHNESTTEHLVDQPVDCVTEGLTERSTMPAIDRIVKRSMEHVASPSSENSRPGSPERSAPDAEARRYAFPFRV